MDERRLADGRNVALPASAWHSDATDCRGTATLCRGALEVVSPSSSVFDRWSQHDEFKQAASPAITGGAFYHAPRDFSLPCPARGLARTLRVLQPGRNDRLYTQFCVSRRRTDAGAKQKDG